MHIIRDLVVLADDFENGTGLSATLVDPDPAALSISVSMDHDVTLTGKSGFASTIVDSNLMETNGVVHKVDTVFLPVRLSQTHLDVLKSDSRFSSQFYHLAVVAGMEDLLMHGNLTMFAPESNLTENVFNDLKGDSCAARKLFAYHLLEGVYIDMGMSSAEFVTLSNKTVQVDRESAQYNPDLQVDFKLIVNEHSTIRTILEENRTWSAEVLTVQTFRPAGN
jgi:uncharacterized surface protein with fasciclin (FAS1) repeats